MAQEEFSGVSVNWHCGEAVRRSASVVWQAAENGRIFADEQVRKKLQQEEFMTIDPVCGMRVDEKQSEFHSQFGGREYSFCSADCKQEFEADPEEFADTVAA
jgi:YHS domain-containing protein